MSDINNAQTAVAAYCAGDIGLGDRLVESSAAAQQGLEMEDESGRRRLVSDTLGPLTEPVTTIAVQLVPGEVRGLHR